MNMNEKLYIFVFLKFGKLSDICFCLFIILYNKQNWICDIVVDFVQCHILKSCSDVNLCADYFIIPCHVFFLLNLCGFSGLPVGDFGNGEWFVTIYSFDIADLFPRSD